jgi:hypothetical protein
LKEDKRVRRERGGREIKIRNKDENDEKIEKNDNKGQVKRKKRSAKKEKRRQLWD